MNKWITRLSESRAKLVWTLPNVRVIDEVNKWAQCELAQTLPNVRVIDEVNKWVSCHFVENVLSPTFCNFSSLTSILNLLILLFVFDSFLSPPSTSSAFIDTISSNTLCIWLYAILSSGVASLRWVSPLPFPWDSRSNRRQAALLFPRKYLVSFLDILRLQKD